VSPSTSNSIRRWAVKPIISRSRSASELFSRSVRRFMISSLIGGSSNQVDVATRPYRRIIDDHREAARPLRRYGGRACMEGARAGGFAIAELHSGPDRQHTAPCARRLADLKTLAAALSNVAKVLASPDAVFQSAPASWPSAQQISDLLSNGRAALEKVAMLYARVPNHLKVDIPNPESIGSRQAKLNDTEDDYRH
jgi:hypothetical protein